MVPSHPSPEFFELHYWYLSAVKSPHDAYCFPIRLRASSRCIGGRIYNRIDTESGIVVCTALQTCEYLESNKSKNSSSSHLQVRMSQVTTRAQARAQEQKVRQEPEVDKYELDRRAASGETVVKGGEGGLSLEAQQHLAAGRKTGGITRKHQIVHEGYHDLGMKGHPPDNCAAATSEVAK